MAWVVKLEEVHGNKTVSRRKVMTIDRPHRIESVDDIGLSSTEAKQLLSSIQTLVAAAQFQHDADDRRVCADCGCRQSVKDYRSRSIDTLYGRITARCPRYSCACCEQASFPTLARSTSEYDEIRARRAAHLPYRVVSNILRTLLPVDAGAAHTTLRNRTAHVAT